MSLAQKNPGLFHGLMAGAVLLVAKLILAFSGNWLFRISGTFSFISFLVLLTAVLLGGRGERKLKPQFGYGKAWLSAVRTIFLAIFISVIGDQIAYRSNPELATLVVETQVKELQKNLPQLTMFSESIRDTMLEKAEEANPRDLYSLTGALSNIFTYLLLNSLWALLAAGFTRAKKSNELAEEEF